MPNRLSSSLKTCIVIPARLASTRLPEKLLLRETGKSVLQHTYEAAQAARYPVHIVVAVDHQRLADEVQRFGGNWQMTDPQAASGTDRVAEIARHHSEFDLFVNVQGDEPEIAGDAIDLAAELLMQHDAASVSTLATPLRRCGDFEDPSCVKVVMDHQGYALYFSRSPIPFPREPHDQLWENDPPQFFQHLGLYAYRRDFLLALGELPPSPLEQLEKLEQLRFLQAGHRMIVGRVEHRARGIDTLADYQAFVNRHAKC